MPRKKLNPIEQLYTFLKSISPVAVSLSGGLDSSTLAFFCVRSGIPCTAYTFSGPHLTFFEIKQVQNWVRRHKIKHKFLYFDPLAHKEVTANSPVRCYYCKFAMFGFLRRKLSGSMALVDGTSFSDSNKYRPGIRALSELGVASPFMRLGLDREIIKNLARQMGLSGISAYSRSCLLTRFDYNYPVTRKNLNRIRKVEDFLLKNCISGFRIRIFRSGRVVLQVDHAQANRIQELRYRLVCRMAQENMHPFDLQFMDFEQITGYFDHSLTSEDKGSSNA